MANINGEWLDREARQNRIDLIEKTNAKLEKLRKLGTIRPSQVKTLVSNKRELIRLKRIHRAEYDLLYFMYEYFSEDRNPGNDANLLPARQTYETAAEFHRELCSILDEITRSNVQSSVGYSVGRRHAKTAYLSNGYLTHQVVFRHKRYIVEVSETTDVAGDFTTWSRFHLKFNQKLREDFGALLHERSSQNELDNKYGFITTRSEERRVGKECKAPRET